MFVLLCFFACLFFLFFVLLLFVLLKSSLSAFFVALFCIFNQYKVAMVTVTTTAGTGSETTGTAVFDFTKLKAKTGTITTQGILCTRCCASPQMHLDVFESGIVFVEPLRFC